MKKIYDLDQMHFFMNFLKHENPIFLPSTQASDYKIDMLRVVT